MQNAIDQEKRERLAKAAAMNRVPLLQLDTLMKERRAYALENRENEVEVLNQMIRELLAL